MSAVWTLGIKCEKCPATFGVRSIPSAVRYGQVLQAIRAEAAEAGWTSHHGPMRRSYDYCPKERS